MQFLHRTLSSLALVLTLAATALGQPAPTWQWAAAGGSADFDEATAVCVDAQGNTYVTGSTTGAAQFGSATLTSQGGVDLFVAKYDPSGALLWLRGGGSPQDDGGTGIAVDAAGNCYVSGTIGDAATFDTQTTTNTGVEAAVVLRYNAAGDLQWVRSPAATPMGSGTSYGGGVAVDAAGNAYVVGGFEGHLAFGVAQLHSIGGSDAFVVSLDANAVPRFARSFGGSDNEDAVAIGLDAAGNYYVEGGFVGSLLLGAGFPALSAIGTKDGYVAKFNASGTPQWAKGFGGIGSETLPSGLAVSTTGDCYVVGDSDAGTVDFDLGQVDNPSTIGGYVGYVAKFAATGALRWAYGAGSNQNAGTYGVALRGAALHLTGAFAGTTTFGSSAAPVTLVSTTLADVFVARYDTAGQLTTVTAASGTRANFDASVGQAIAIDALGSSRVTGFFGGISAGGRIKFGALPVFTARGEGDVFTALLSVGPMAAPHELAEASFRVFPNPVAPAQRLTVAGLPSAAPVRLTLLDALGRAVQATTAAPAAGTAAWVPAAVPAGLYSLRAEQAGAVLTRRVVVE